MIDLYLLEQLVTFKECGSLNLAAEKLYVTQPALSKSMKKLEDDLGYPIFIRSNKKLQLNKTGEYLANKAKEYLKSGEDLLLEVNEYNRSLNNISIGSCAPAPLWELLPTISNLYKDTSITSMIENNDDILYKGLNNNAYQLIITTNKINDDSLYIKELKSETLFVSVPKNHRLYKKKNITIKDLDNELAIVYKDIGIWMDFVKDNIPNLHLMVMDDINALDNAIRLGMTLSFTTDYSRYEVDDNKKLHFKDLDATIHYYLICKKENYKRFEKIISI